MSVASRLFRASDLIISRTQVKPLSLCSRLPSYFHHGRPLCSSVFSNCIRRNSIRTYPSISAFLSDPYGSPPPGSRVNGRVLFFSTSAPNPHKTPSSESTVADTKILRTLASYLWMGDNIKFRFRVITALSFLVGAKVLSVQVPFLFKLAVDWLTSETGTASANPTLVAAFATPSAVLIGYGIARSTSSAFNELRTAAFAKVALRAICCVSRKVFSHLHDLDVHYHQSRQTGGLNRIIDRGSHAINFILSSTVFNVVPTILEVYWHANMEQLLPGLHLFL